MKLEKDYKRKLQLKILDIVSNMIKHSNFNSPVIKRIVHFGSIFCTQKSVTINPELSP